MDPEVAEILSKPTADVPKVGRVFYGLGSNASYRAAASGDIKAIKIGGRWRALTAPLRALTLQTEAQSQNNA